MGNVAIKADTGRSSQPTRSVARTTATKQSSKVRSILHAGSSDRLQAKLRINTPGDVYEQEADHVAEQVMRMPEPQLSSSEDERRTVEPATLFPKCLTQEEGLIQSKQTYQLIQRQESLEEGEEEELIQAKMAGGVTPEVTPAISGRIQSLQGGGQPLSKPARSFFEPRFGADFSKVRVHNDTQAASLARLVNARAFTLGHNVVFGAGEYSPDTSSGRRLLAHELTHTLQQKNNLTTKHLTGKNINNLPVRKVPQQIQKDPVSIAGLGLAAFSTGKELATSGRLSHKSSPATYMHPGTPASAKWNNVIKILHVKAWSPRPIVGGWEHFYFRLEYDYNGYDIRNATINVLRSKSSGMYSSTFDITWSPDKHSRPKDPVAQIVFNISGQWDPWGRGDYSFWGKLVISAAKNGRNFELFTIGSETESDRTVVRRG